MSKGARIVFILFISISTAGRLNAQLEVPATEVPSPLMESSVLDHQDESPANTADYKRLLGYGLQSALPTGTADGMVGPSRSMQVPRIYNFEELSFFCKWEVELEKAARLPVKFRLGSVDYVDWLEGKRRYDPQQQ